MQDTPCAHVQWAGERFTLSPLRLAYWARRRTLLVADLHLGKPAAFRHAGVPVPEECTSADLSRLSEALLQFPTDRLVMLGDLLHARTARAQQTIDTITRWRTGHAELDIVLVRGNHDAHAGDPPEEWGFRVADEPFAEPDDGVIAFAHYPEAAQHDRDRFVLAGHVHPAVRLTRGSRSLRTPCFWFSGRFGVLPAFGSFTGTAVVTPSVHDQVFIVGDDAVVPAHAPGAQNRARATRA